MLNFLSEPRFKYDHWKVGSITILPEVEFEVNAYAEPDSYPKWKFYTVTARIFGCICGVKFSTPSEIEAYIERQKANVPRYKELGAKRRALTRRVTPLQNKIMQNVEALFALAEAQGKIFTK